MCEWTGVAPPSSTGLLPDHVHVPDHVPVRGQAGHRGWAPRGLGGEKGEGGTSWTSDGIASCVQT